MWDRFYPWGRPQGDVEVAVYVPHEHGGARERRQGRQGPRQAREVPHGRRQPRGEKEREAPDLTQAAAVWNPHMSEKLSEDHFRLYRRRFSFFAMKIQDHHQVHVGTRSPRSD